MKDSSVDVGTITVKGYRCERCGHTWTPRSNTRKGGPLECPKCRSAYWRDKRIRPKQKGRRR